MAICLKCIIRRDKTLPLFSFFPRHSAFSLGDLSALAWALNWAKVSWAFSNRIYLIQQASPFCFLIWHSAAVCDTFEITRNSRKYCFSLFLCLFFLSPLLMYVPKGLCLCSLWTTLWMIILLRDYYSSAHHGTSTQTQTERLDSSVLHYGFIISTVSCLEMCSKHRSSSITVKSWDVKQFIYQRFYWWLKNGVCWWLLFSFKYVNGFQICKWFSVYDFWLEQAHKGLIWEFKVISCAPCAMAHYHLILSPVQ